MLAYDHTNTDVVAHEKLHFSKTFTGLILLWEAPTITNTTMA